MTHTVVIGGTKGLGKVVTNLLSYRGDIVSVIGKSELKNSGTIASNITGYQVDITDEINVLNVLDRCYDSTGPINYCVFLQRYRGTGDSWSGEIETTLTATRAIVDYVTPLMMKTEDCAFLMVSSVFAKYVGEGQPLSYHVAKAALDQMVRFYALNLGPFGVRCNAITPFTFLKDESKKYYLENKSLNDLYNQIIPLGRMPTTDDSAKAIKFLCSAEASYVTGQNIAIDGGLSLVWPETLARKLMKI